MRHHSPLVSVHRLRIACPVCGHRDNCAVTEDRTRAYCRRVRSDYQGRDGGWLHILDDVAPPPSRPIVTPAPPLPPLADRRIRSDIYTALLLSLPLLTPHHEDLRRRGLTDEAIRCGMFRSTPTESEAREIISNLNCDFEGIPGFYRDLCGYCMVKTWPGFFIPVRDRAGLIQALQVRRDHVGNNGDARYIWFSSGRYSTGVSSGAPVHIQNPERITETGRAIITEGALKAFIAAQFLSPDEGGIIAFAGVSTFREGLGQQLKEAWPKLSHIAVAFDADWQTKKEVMAQLRRLIQTLKASFESVEVMEWENEKGLDDFLINESHEVAEVA